MAGTALTNFADFVASTGPSYLTSPEKFLNEAMNQSLILDRFLRGRGMDEVIQGGQQIKDVVMFDESNTNQTYKPNEEFTWTQPQVATEMEIPWRFTVDHMSWTDQEIELNMNGGFSRSYIKVQYKRRKKMLEQRVWTSMVKGFEKRLFADAHGTANEAQMETATGQEPYSLLAFFSEDSVNFKPNGWTTVMNINPSNESRWRNQIETYDVDDPDDSDGDQDGLIDAFDNMITKVQFIAPNFHKEQFENQKMDTYRQFIACSRNGLNQYKRLLRAANDTLVYKQDASYNHPQFAGQDLVYVTELDTAIIWDFLSTGAAGGTSYGEDGKDSTGATPSNAMDGPRYLWVNGNYLKVVFHTNRYFYKLEPYNMPNQPFTWIAPIDCWYNVFMQSEQRQGVVGPNA